MNKQIGRILLIFVVGTWHRAAVYVLLDSLPEPDSRCY